MDDEYIGRVEVRAVHEDARYSRPYAYTVITTKKDLSVLVDQHRFYTEDEASLHRDATILQLKSARKRVRKPRKGVS